ncbi:transposase [Kitasatospora sp. NPDC096147]|uniref:transposase n=1 Tax=Kitasatospora sp. NPDC096147 TaxID=3364093 RepID=UPI003827060B
MGEIEQLRSELAAFVAEVFASVSRKDTREWGDCYLRGLMLNGRRKSVQPMAEWLPDGVARQWREAPYKQSNCQVGVSLHAASDTASVPIT